MKLYSIKLKIRNVVLRWMAVIAVFCLFVPAAAFATGLTNLSFETDLSGWTASGNVQRINPDYHSPDKNISGQTGYLATDGSWFALLSTSPDSFVNGMPPGVDSGFDRDGSGADEFDIATLSQSFTLTAPSTLALDWTIATSEFDGWSTAGLADIAEIRLLPAAGAPISLVQCSLDDGYNDGSFAPLYAGDFSGISWTTSDPTLPASSFYDGTYLGGFQTVTSSILGAGDYTLEFFVGDEGDGSFDTGLIVDNIRVSAAAVPEPSSFFLIASFLPVLAGLHRRHHRSVKAAGA
ncbi:MAG: hypothetical protein GXP58_04120 [Deltaproteobacteria bacterium]|nr:hypothetical protein [Deltaproteobacteria bacterium]